MPNAGSRRFQRQSDLYRSELEEKEALRFETVRTSIDDVQRRKMRSLKERWKGRRRRGERKEKEEEEECNSRCGGWKKWTCLIDLFRAP